MKKELKKYAWNIIFVKKDDLIVGKIIHVIYIYSDYSIYNEFENYNDDLWETWNLLMKAHRE